MGSESSKSESNSSKSDSDSSSNSGKKNGILETMDCLEENHNTMIYRIWIVKKSISMHDMHVLFLAQNIILTQILMAQKLDLNNNNNRPLSNLRRIFDYHPNIFEIKDESKSWFKHWAIILELSNGTFVNIQFDCNGFSLKEFNRTNIDGENLLNSIIETWGEESHPSSFCYLGNANYKYKELKRILTRIKNEEFKTFRDKRSIYYHFVHRNCQHFACDIEKILFGSIRFWHSFDYYLNGFYNKFFPNVDMNLLKAKYQEDLNRRNGGI